MVDFVADAAPIDVTDVDDARAVAPIGLNKPMRIEIHKIYTGPEHEGEVLITSAVKSAMTFDAAPYALLGVRPDVKPNSFIEFTATDEGSPIVYYTPACLDTELQVQIRLSYDTFNKDRYGRYVDLFAKAANLPVFAAGAALFGPVGAAAAPSAILAVKRAVTVMLGAIDRRIDRDNDFIADHTIHLATPGVRRAKAGWLLFRDNGKGSELSVSINGMRTEAETDDDQFYVDIRGDKPVLRYKGSNDEVKDLDQSYVLAHVSGNKDDSLAHYQRTAVSAVLADKFLNVKDDTIEDISELMEAYNDLVMTKQIADLDNEIKNETEAEAKKALTDKRAAVVKHIQDKDIRDLLPAAEQ